MKKTVRTNIARDLLWQPIESTTFTVCISIADKLQALHCGALAHSSPERVLDQQHHFIRILREVTEFKLKTNEERFKGLISVCCADNTYVPEQYPARSNIGGLVFPATTVAVKTLIGLYICQKTDEDKTTSETILTKNRPREFTRSMSLWRNPIDLICPVYSRPPPFKQMAGSVVSWKPEQIALRTALRSNFPERR